LKELRTHASLDDTLILFVTSHRAPDIETRALSAGAIDFVHKPVHADIVRARVRNYLALKQQGDTLAMRVKELQAASEHVRELQGIIPICMHCKRIRNETQIWEKVETYITRHSEAQFSHALCTECLNAHYPDTD
jgi:PleD family two-component response regulator